MNLAFLAKRYDIVGGTEKDLFELTRLLAAFGHEIHIYCGQIRHEAARGVSLHEIPCAGPGRTALLKSVAKTGPEMARSGGHDLLYSFTRTLDQDVIRCGGGIHRTYLAAMAEDQSGPAKLFRKMDPYHRATLKIEEAQYLAPKTRELTAISQVVKDEILANFPVPEEKIKIIYDGISPEEFTGKDGSAIRKQFNIPAEAPLILFVGNGFRRKGLEALLKAFDLLENQNTRLLIVGTDQQEALFRQKTGDRVIFSGVQKDPSPFYAAADVLALPSKHEAFGNVVLEALAAGIPAAVSARAGASEVLTGDLRKGVIKDPGNPAEVARAIQALLTLGNVSDQAQAIATSYTFENNARAIEAQCQRLIEG